MRPDTVRDVEKLYDQTLKFLEGEGITEKAPNPGPRRSEYQNNFSAVPERYLLKDNLLLLLEGSLKYRFEFVINCLKLKNDGFAKSPQRCHCEE